MAEAKKYTAAGVEAGNVTLPESLFAVECKNPNAVLYEVINMFLANKRQGTVATRNRSDVRGSKSKLFRQKGTGNARVGSRRTVVRVGGGVAFGPLPRDWYRNIPKKKKRLALKLALTERANNGQIHVIESLQMEKPSTKTAKELLKNISPNNDRKLVVIDGSDKNIVRSFSNIQRVEMNRADSINAYEILKAKCLILTEDALKKIVEVFA